MRSSCFYKRRRRQPAGQKTTPPLLAGTGVPVIPLRRIFCLSPGRHKPRREAVYSPKRPGQAKRNGLDDEARDERTQKK